MRAVVTKNETAPVAKIITAFTYLNRGVKYKRGVGDSSASGTRREDL